MRLCRDLIGSEGTDVVSEEINLDGRVAEGAGRERVGALRVMPVDLDRWRVLCALVV